MVIAFPAIYIYVVLEALVFVPVALAGGTLRPSSVFIVFSLSRLLVITFYVFISRTLLEASHSRVALSRLQVRPHWWLVSPLLWVWVATGVLFFLDLIAVLLARALT